MSRPGRRHDIIRQNELFTQIHMLWIDDKQHGLHKIQYYGQKNTRFELTTYKAKKELHDNFIFTYAVRGRTKTWFGNTPRPHVWTTSADIDNPKGHSAWRRMVDVRAEVEGSIADETTSNELELKDEFEWFVEYVKAVFPLRLAVFRISEYEQGDVWQAPKAEIEFIRQHVYAQLLNSSDPTKDFGGPLTKEVMSQFQKLMADPDVLLLPQGLKTGEHTRLVGGDSTFMYERDLRNGSVYMISSGKYLHELYIGQLAGDVYESTRGMQPFIQVVVWGGVLLMGGAVMGISAAAIRVWVVEQVESAITSKMIKDLIWKFFRPAIIALIVELVLYLFELAANALPASVLTDFEGVPVPPNNMAKLARRVRFLAKGFFEGYLINTIVDHLWKHLVVDTVEKKVIGNIREVKMYLLTKQAYAAIDKVRDLIHTIEGQLDGPAMHRGTMLLQEITGRLARSFAGLFATLYHLPFSQAKDILEVFGLDPAGAMPSPEQWDAEAQVQLKKIIGTFESLTSLKSIDETLESLRNGKLLPIIGTVMVLESEIIWGVEYTVHHLPKKWQTIIIAIGAIIAVAGLVEADVATGGAVHRVGFELITDFVHLPASDEEAQRVGEMIGNIFGAFFFNSVMFDKGGILHNFRDKHPILGGAVWGNVKASPIEAIVTLLLKRYVMLYDKVKQQLGKLTRAAGEHAFAEALHAIEDKQLEDDGFGHLKAFRTEHEDQVSLQNIGLALFRIRHVIKSDLADWIHTRYGDDIARYKSDLAELNKLGIAATQINVENVLEHDAPQFFHLLAQQLVQTLDELVATVRSMFEPFTTGDLSWATFLKALGVDIGDVKKVQKQIMDEAKAELQGFRQLAKGS